MKLQDLFLPVVGLDNELETDVDNTFQKLLCFCRGLFVDWEDIWSESTTKDK
jgi:hypothetical protein